jgi:ATP-binding cassette subfamily B protein
MSAGTLGQFVLYAMLGGGSVGALAEVWNDVQRAAGGMGRINELLQERAASWSRPRIPRAAAALARRHSLRRRRLPLSLAPDLRRARRLQPARAPRRNRGAGRPSGAGKSTVFALLLRFHDPQSGRVRSTASTCALDPAACANRSRSSRRSPTIFATTAATTSATAGWKPPTPSRTAAALGAEAHEFLAACRRLRERTRRARRAPVRRPAAAHRDRARAC